MTAGLLLTLPKKVLVALSLTVRLETSQLSEGFPRFRWQRVRSANTGEKSKDYLAAAVPSGQNYPPDQTNKERNEDGKRI